MRIESFSYNDKMLEWELKPMSFSDLTLLVGLSGVGKTQILQALLDIKAIAKGEARNGVSWDISFCTLEGKAYRWKGEFEKKQDFVDPYFEFPDEIDSTTREMPKIINESLLRDGKEILTRDPDEIIFFEKKMPKLSPSDSVLSILSNEDDVDPVSNAFRRIKKSVFLEPMSISFIAKPTEQLSAQYNTLEKIRESDLPTTAKLALVCQTEQEVFKEIKERFIDIFPQVTDIKVEPTEEGGLPPFITQIPMIQIKERGVSKWILQRHISSGMLRTILHLAEIYLWPTGTVILIDEFENSLGVNCIDVLTDDLLQQHRDLQFIITSHHPYIINNIDPKYWKVVHRKGGQVTTSDASALGIGDSSHDAFIQLINNEKYNEGINL